MKHRGIRAGKLFVLGLLLALATALCGCSAADFSLPQSVDLAKGETYPLLQSVLYQGQEPDQDELAAGLALLEQSDGLASLAFASSDGSVVWVDAQGVLHAGKPGDATVTVRCDALGATYSVDVHVPATPATLTLSGPVMLAAGQTHPLDTVVYPSDAEEEVEYRSADEKVAGVDAAGVVSAVGNGRTEITASVPGTSLTASCTVYVGDAVQSVALTRAEAALAVGERTVLGAVVTPEGAPGEEPVKRTWTSSDPAVAAVGQDGGVTALAPGSAEIAVQAGDKTAACRLTVRGAATPESVTGESATPESATAETATAESATPESAIPENATPESAASESATPESAIPENAAPESATPETATPESATSETATPESATAESAAPEKATPESSTAESATPETAAGETAAEAPATRETAAPEGAAGEPATPESAAAPQATPESAPPAPVSATPETAAPEPATPETATGETATAETATAESATAETATGESAQPGKTAADWEKTAQKVAGKLRGVLEKMFSWNGDAESAAAEAAQP